MVSKNSKNTNAYENESSYYQDKKPIINTLYNNDNRAISTKDRNLPFDTLSSTNNYTNYKNNKANKEGLKINFSLESTSNTQADNNKCMKKSADYTIGDISIIENVQDKKNKTEAFKFKKNMNKNTCFENIDSFNESFSSFMSEKLNLGKSKSIKKTTPANIEVYNLPLAYKEKDNCNLKDEKEAKIKVNLTFYDKKQSKSIVVNSQNDLGLNFYESQIENSNANYINRYNDYGNNYKFNKNDRNVCVVKQVKRERKIRFALNENKKASHKNINPIKANRSIGRTSSKKSVVNTRQIKNKLERTNKIKEKKENKEVNRKNKSKSKKNNQKKVTNDHNDKIKENKQNKKSFQTYDNDKTLKKKNDNYAISDIVLNPSSNNNGNDTKNRDNNINNDDRRKKKSVNCGCFIF